MSDQLDTILELKAKLAEREEESKRAAKIQAALYEVADAASASLNMQEFYAAVHRIVGELMYANNFFVAEYDEATGILSFPYFKDEADAAPPMPQPMQTFRGATGYVLRTGRLTHYRRNGIQLLQSGEIEIVGTPSEDSIFVPLKLGHRVLGALAIQIYQPGVAYYTEQDEDMLEFVAQHIAQALTRARALEETRQRNSELQIINSVQEGLASKLDYQAIIDLVGDQVRETFKSDTTYIFLYDRAANLITRPYYVERGFRHNLEPLAFGEGLTSVVINTRKPLLLGTNDENDELNVPGSNIASPEQEKDLNETYLGVPIMVGDEVKGVVSVQSYQQNAYGEADVRLLQTLANSMSAALENARLFDEVQKRNQEITEALEQQTATTDILRVIAGSPSDIQPVMDVIAEHAMSLCEGMNSSVYLTDGKLVYEAVSRDATPEARELNKTEYPRPLAYDSSLSSRAILGKAVLNIADSQNDPSLPELTREYSRVLGMKSILFVPLLKDGEARGALAVSHGETGLFSDKHVALLKTFADQAVIAIENVRLFNETKRLLKETEQRAAELAIINSVQEGLATKLDMQAIYVLVGDKIRETFPDAQEVGILTYDRAADLLHPQYAIERGVRLDIKPWTPVGFRKNVLLTGQPMIINRDAARLAAEYNNPVIAGERAKSYAFVPLVVGQDVTGIIELEHMDREDAFGEADVRLLETLANSMSVALENARLFDQTQSLLKETEQRAAELAIINSVQEGLASKLDMQAIYDLVGEKIREIFHADTTYICSYESDKHLVYSHFYVDGDQRVPPQSLPFGEGMYSRVIQSRHSILIQTGDEEEAKASTSIASPGSDQDLNLAALYVPIMMRDQVTGVVSVQSHKQYAYTENDSRLLSTLASSLGAALENARLFDEVQKRNQEITEALEQQTATGEILRVIASSPTDIQPVLDAVAESAARLCDSYDAAIARVEGSVYKVVAHWGPVSLPEANTREGIPLTRETVTGRAIVEKRSIHVDDVLEEPESEYPLSKEFNKTSGQRTLLATPLMREGRAIGAIFIIRKEVNPFTDKQVALLKVFADQAAIAIENVRLFDETKRLLKETEQRAAELAIINSVQEGLASKLDMQAIYDLVGDKIRDVFDAQAVLIDAFDHARQTDQLIYGSENGRRIFDAEARPFPPHVRYLIENRQPIVIDHDAIEVGKQYGVKVVEGTEVAKSMIYVPFGTSQQVNGYFSLQNLDREYAFSASDVRLLQTLAGSMGIALENARLFDETQRLLKETEQRAAELSVINSVQKGLASKLDMQAIYDLVGDKIRDIFQTEVVYIAIRNGERTEQFDFPYYLDRGARLSLEPVTLGQGITSRVIESRQAVIAGSMKQQIELGGIYDDAELSQSYLGVPIFLGDEVMGVASVQSYRTVAFGDADVRLLTTLAASMGVALENARLFDETQRLLKETDQRAAELAIINSVQEGLASKLEMQAIYDLVGDKIRDVFDSQAVTIALYDRRNSILQFPYYLHRGERLAQEPIAFGEGLTSHVVRSRQPLLINQDAEERYAELGAVFVTGDDNARSWLGVPITSGSEATGAIFLQNYERENAYTEADVRLLSTIATSMGVALENARLFDETQRLLKETDQRAAELAIINSVQEGLAAKLDAPAIYELVGDKIRDIHPNVDVGIRILDPQTNLIHYPYLREKGKRIEIPSRPLAERGFIPHVLRTRQILAIAENMAEKLEEYGSYVLPGTEMAKSAVYAPLFVGGEARGVVSLGSLDREHAFSEADVRLLQTLTSSLGIALEKAGLFEAERKRAAELSAISKVSQALVAETELDSMVQLIGKQLRDIFSADIVYVALLNSQTNLIEFPYQFGEEIAPRRLGEGLTSKIIQTGQPVLINQDVDTQLAGLGTKKVGVEARSYLGVPILAGRHAIGVISVQSTKEENAFNEDDARLLSTIAANAGAAIQTARLHAETQRRAQEMATLAEIGNDIAASRELEPVLERIAAHAKDILNVRDIAIRLLDSDGRTLSAAVALGTYAAEYKAVVLRLGEGLTGAIAASGVAEFVNEPSRDPRVVHVPGTPEEEDEQEGMMVAPLISRGQTIGVIGVWRPHDAGLFTQAELDFLVSVARQTAIAIESARLYLETQRRANEMSALTEVGREISASLDPAVVLRLIASRARELLAADTSAVYLMESDKRSLKAVTAIGDLAEDVKSDPVVLGQGVIGALAREAKAEFVNDTAHDPRAVDIPGTNEVPNERLMAAPLLKGDAVVGMLAVWRSADPFTEADLNFLVGLARQASIGHENARLFAEIKAEKQYSEALVQNSPVAIMSIDTDASVVAWNPGAEKLFGYSAEEAIGRNIDDLVANDPGIREQAGGFFTQLGRAEQIHAITKRTRKDGTFVDVEVAGVPVIVDGKNEGLIGIYHDITELQRARQEAVAANEAKSAFLATMSHEIRTPMNAVIGMSGLLMDTELNKEQFDYAETIRNSGDALLAIINDILDFSKIEAGKMELEHQAFDLRECVESALDLVAGRAVEKRIDLAYIIDDEVAAGIKGDVTRLRQILLNLMSNAVKFTEKGEVVLTVKQDKVAERLLFAVRDTGIGIPADRMGRLFESFSQADSSTTRRFGGTGLGLVISKRLAEMMGGTMWVESAGAGRGSTFSFTMQAPPALIAERRTARDIKGIQPSLEGKRVLIVDDNATNRRILVLQTKKWGMAPRETESPREALKWLKTDDVLDLAILDVQMPEMDGLMLTRELRKLENRVALPIILLTSLGRKEIGAEALDFAAYLSKPLKPSALFDALAGIFARNIVTPKAQPAKVAKDDEMGKRHPLRILLAEDNAVNQKLALRLLEQMGYRADVASNGLEAVESLERQSYDVVLMDVQMPEMDGLDATRAIRKLTNVTQPRVVAMTANAMQGDREMCLAAGMDDYVSKPIRVAELKEALQRTKSPAPATSSRHRQPEPATAIRKTGKPAGKKTPSRAKTRTKSALKSRKK